MRDLFLFFYIFEDAMGFHLGALDIFGPAMCGWRKPVAGIVRTHPTSWNSKESSIGTFGLLHLSIMGCLLPTNNPKKTEQPFFWKIFYNPGI